MMIEEVMLYLLEIFVLNLDFVNDYFSMMMMKMKVVMLEQVLNLYWLDLDYVQIEKLNHVNRIEEMLIAGRYLVIFDRLIDESLQWMF